jgi:hypothetical protein
MSNPFLQNLEGFHLGFPSISAQHSAGGALASGTLCTRRRSRAGNTTVLALQTLVPKFA